MPLLPRTVEVDRDLLARLLHYVSLGQEDDFVKHLREGELVYGDRNRDTRLADVIESGGSDSTDQFEIEGCALAATKTYPHVYAIARVLLRQMAEEEAEERKEGTHHPHTGIQKKPKSRRGRRS